MNITFQKRFTGGMLKLLINSLALKKTFLKSLKIAARFHFKLHCFYFPKANSSFILKNVFEL